MAPDSPVKGWARRRVAGPRLFLRQPEASDWEAFSSLVQASFEFLRPWEPWLDYGPDPSGRHRFDRLMQYRTNTATQKHFVCRRTDGALLGMMNLNNIVRGVFQGTALGYWVGAPYARTGVMTEAISLALHLAFEGLGLHRVEACIRPENTASIALVRRAGFRYEGLSLRMLQIAGQWADHERWALLGDEWAPTDGVALPERHPGETERA